MQNDFCEPNGSLGVKGSQEIVQPINELRKEKWDLIALSRDCHPDDHVSFAKNHDKEPFSGEITVERTGRKQMMWPVHCVEGSEGYKYHPDLKLEDSDLEVLKGRVKDWECYSAFGSEGEDTGLAKNLRDRGITKVVCVGLAFDYCVGSTAVDAAKEGFKTTLLSDHTKSVMPETHQVMVENLKAANVEVVTKEEYFK